jgi:hypothetical protein
VSLTVNRRVTQLEVKNAGTIKSMADELRAKELEAWRAKNYNRISWELFVLIKGPQLEHPDNYIYDDSDREGPFAEQNKAYVDSHLAFFDMIDRVMKHRFDEEGFLRKSKMSTKEEMAFAVCFEELFWSTDTEDGMLLKRGICDQAIALGFGSALHDGEMSVAEVVEKIDEHRGGPEWRQICDTNADQEALDVSLGIPTITETPPPGLPWRRPEGGIGSVVGS